MHLNKKDLQDLGSVKRLNIINSITGIKPANLVGTVSKDKSPNVAIFSSIVHLGSNPALIGLIVRPTGEVPRNTYENILVNGKYTINHVNENFIKNAHYTSAKFDREISEFDRCGLTEEYLFNFKAPFVKESNVKIGMKYCESIPIERNGTILVIGEVEHLIIPDEAMNEKGYIDLEKAQVAGISGLNSYYSLKKITSFPYVRSNEVPEFTNK
ncbi:MAG: flavin reductase family protein [Flavobacteriales bacterium]